MASSAIPYSGIQKLVARNGGDPSVVPNGPSPDVMQLAPPHPVSGPWTTPGSDIPSLDTNQGLIPIFGPAAASANAAAQPPNVTAAPNPAQPIGNVSTPPTQMPQYRPSFLTRLVSAARSAMPYVGAVGAGMEAVGGTPEQKEAAAQYAAQQRQFALERPKIEAETEATQAETALRRRQADLMGQMATITLSNGQVMQVPLNQVGNFTRGGLAADLNNQGKVAVQLLKEEADQDLKAAQAAYQNARADLITDPNNPTFQQNERKIRAQLAMAQQKMALANQGMELRQREFGINNYGIDPSTGQAPPGILLDENGTPIGNKQAGNVRPTAAARGRAEQATAIEAAAIPLIRDIRTVGPQVLGPLLGRYGSLTKFVGDPPPAYAQLAAELTSWIALHPAAHGFRGVRAVEEFEKAFGNPNWTPESLSAAIMGSFGTMNALRQVGTPRTATGGGPPSSIVPAPIANAVNSTQRPAGATGKAPGTDGKYYWHDAKGNNLGLVQGQR